MEQEILKIYYREPEKKFTLRELSKESKLPLATVQRKMKKLDKLNLIKNGEIVDSLYFRTKKITFYIKELIKSGLIDDLIKHFNPSCIILFGSIRKGESNKNSDIDIFIESHISKPFNVTKFNKKLKHEISLFVYKSILDVPYELRMNIINGISLYGVLKL
jgi:predicted nucleotidyltransferase